MEREETKTAGERGEVDNESRIELRGRKTQCGKISCTRQKNAYSGYKHCMKYISVKKGTFRITDIFRNDSSFTSQFKFNCKQ